ncbi:MAG: hypothetical protein FWE33_04695 [Defluviitaleaceae bacterium]|nr:hypothetical protein [Defluviitaleaceae bacterium]
MVIKPDLSKEEKINKEIKRLRKVFKELDKNKLAAVDSLIRNAAFMSVSLEELQEIINSEGYTQKYKNGANQYGKKQSEAVKIHISMTRNHAVAIKQLADLAPSAPIKRDALHDLRDF